VKELFKATFSILKKDKTIWILAISIYCLIMTIGLSLSAILGLGNLLLVIFVVCPFVFTFIKLSIKGIDNVPLDDKDVYLGYKDLSRSISIVIRKLLVPFFVSLLFYIFSYLVISFIYIYFYEMDLIENIITMVSNTENLTNQDITKIVLNDEEFVKNIMNLNYLSLGLTFIFFNIISNKKILTFIFFMCINTNRINYDYIVSNKKEIKKYRLLLYNIFISLFYVLGLALSFIVSLLLTKIIDNSIIIYLISSLIFFVVSSIAIPFKYIAYTYIFNKHFNSDVGKLLEEELNYKK